MRQYIVDLADRITGEGQRIAILAEDTDDMSETQHFVNHIGDLKITNPVVIAVTEVIGVIAPVDIPEAV